MDDAPVVGGGERFGDFGPDLHNRLPAHARGGDPLAQGLSLQQLGDREVHPVLLTNVVNLQNVGVGEGGHRLSFALESLEPAGIAGHPVGQHLDGDVARQGGVDGPIDLTHTARTELVQDLVTSETIPRRQCHLSAPGISRTILTEIAVGSWQLAAGSWQLAVARRDVFESVDSIPIPIPIPIAMEPGRNRDRNRYRNRMVSLIAAVSIPITARSW